MAVSYGYRQPSSLTVAAGVSHLLDYDEDPWVRLQNDDPHPKVAAADLVVQLLLCAYA